MWRQVRRVAVIAALVLLTGADAALPIESSGRAALPDESPATGEGVTWQALEASARLDRAGVLHVGERLTLGVAGEATVVERMFRRFVQAEVTVRSIARLEPASGAWRALAPGALDAPDRFEFADGTLRWSLRGPADPAFGANTTLTYQLEYDIAGAVIPIWGVRAFGSAAIAGPFVLHPLERAAELVQAWRLAPGGWRTRYVLDYDFSPFPFLGGAPIDRFSLDLRVDPVWRLLARPGAGRTGVRPNEDLRDFLPLEFIGPGRPASVARSLHAAWVAPLFVLPLLVVALAGWRLAGAVSRKHRFNRTVMDETWIRQRLLSRSPDVVRRLARQSESERSYPGAPAVLEEMERQGKVALDGPPETGTLKLVADRDTLTPWERALVGPLFGGSGTVSAHEAQQRTARAGRDADRPIRDAFEAAHRRSMSRSALGRRFLAPTLIAAGILLVLSALALGGFQALALGLILGSTVYNLLGPTLHRFARSLDLPTWRLALLIVPAVLFSIAEVGFFLTVPAYPRVVIGLGAFWLGLMLVMVDGAWPRWSESDIETRYGLAQARRFISAELAKPHPALDDDWLPWILALGLGDEVENWRRGRGMFVAKPAETEVARAARWTGITPPGIRTETWAERFLQGADA